MSQPLLCLVLFSGVENCRRQYLVSLVSPQEIYLAAFKLRRSAEIPLSWLTVLYVGVWRYDYFGIVLRPQRRRVMSKSTLELSFSDT